MNEIKASIIIPTKDKLSRLRLVLKFLAHQITEEIEVIVVFDGCNPDTIQSFEKHSFPFKPLQVICMENIGRSAARNLGIKLARGQIIIFLDDDRIPGDDFIRRHLEGQREPKVLLGERHNLSLAEPEIENLFYTDNQNHLYHQIKNMANMARESMPQIRRKLLFKLNGTLGWINFYTGNVSIPKDKLIAAGCFDENFSGWGHEDLELGYRLYKQGIIFQIDPGIMNYHMLHHNDTREKFRDSCKNLKYMIQKCRDDKAAYWILRAMLAKIYLERLANLI
jgi:glycosyltransferase involved in cell wall biosynthesis